MFRVCNAGGTWGPSQSTGTFRCQDGQLIPSGNCVIPVELSEFSFEQNDNKIELTWKTLSEINLDRFEVERKFDGDEFITIGSVSGYNNSSGSTYKFEDRFSKEFQYYRLKSMDFDGALEYSKIIGGRNSNSKLAVYPTLVNDLLNIKGNIGLFKIFDIQGKLILKGSGKQVNVSSFHTGSYFLISGNQSSKFIKVD